MCDVDLGPLALLVDNLKCHIFDDSVVKFASLWIEIVALDKNTAAVLQPPDVGVMHDPFKRKLRALAIQFDIAFLKERSHLSSSSFVGSNGSLGLREATRACQSRNRRIGRD